MWEDSSQTLALHHRLPKLFMAPAVAIFLPNASPFNQIIFYLVYSAPAPDQVPHPHSPVLPIRTSKSSLMCVLSWVGTLIQGQNLQAGSPLFSCGVTLPGSRAGPAQRQRTAGVGPAASPANTCPAPSTPKGQYPNAAVNEGLTRFILGLRLAPQTKEGQGGRCFLVKTQTLWQV